MLPYKTPHRNCLRTVSVPTEFSSVALGWKFSIAAGSPQSCRSPPSGGGPKAGTRDGLLWDRSTSRRRLLVYLPQELDPIVGCANPIVGCANYCREPRSPSCVIETHIKSGLSFQGSRPHRVRLPTSLDRLADDIRELTFNVGRVDGGYRERPITWRQIRNLRTRCTGGGDGNLVVEGCAACSVVDYIAR